MSLPHESFRHSASCWVGECRREFRRLFRTKGQFRSDFLRNCPNDVGIHVGAAVFIVECWNRTPHVRWRLIPIGTILHSCANTILPPVRDKIDIFERFQGRARSPFLSRAMNHWSIARKTTAFLSASSAVAVDKFLWQLAAICSSNTKCFKIGIGGLFIGSRTDRPTSSVGICRRQHSNHRHRVGNKPRARC